MHVVPLTNVNHASRIFLEFLKNCLHENISSRSPYRSGFDLSTTNCIWYISLYSTWAPSNSFITFRKRYANLGLFWFNFSKICESCISKFMEPVCICLKVSIKLFWAFCHHLYVIYELVPFLSKFRINDAQRGSKGWGEIRIL